MEKRFAFDYFSHTVASIDWFCKQAKPAYVYTTTFGAEAYRICVFGCVASVWPSVTTIFAASSTPCLFVAHLKVTVHVQCVFRYDAIYSHVRYGGIIRSFLTSALNG
jgi:hypothetical protein